MVKVESNRVKRLGGSIFPGLGLEPKFGILKGAGIFMLLIPIFWTSIHLLEVEQTNVVVVVDYPTQSHNSNSKQVCPRKKREKSQDASQLQKQQKHPDGALPPIYERTIGNVAPNYDGLWDDVCVHNEFKKALEKIQIAEVKHEPFDHIYVQNLFSDEFYKALMNELPHHSMYAESEYAGTKPTYDAIHLAEPSTTKNGRIVVPDDCVRKMRKTDTTGCWRDPVQLHSPKATKGRTLTVDSDATRYPLWTQMIRLAHSRNFTGLLYNKFATGTGVPTYKMEELERQAKGVDMSTILRNSAALRIEPTSYHLTPHVDMHQKVVTWQYFHPENTDLANRMVGTRFYNLKPTFRDMVEMHDVDNPGWLDYSHFDLVKEHPVIPNYFFAFAPNNRSYHGASIDPIQMEGVDHNARRTFLGFVTSKEWNFHHFHKKDWATRDYFYTADV
mmetsp:Transcript_9676/g.20972  ORF Transcript_9676/g.20972 Transcript_9676/m.20972 type:complete len:444 (-) Transcript_9676:87-1418(-)